MTKSHDEHAHNWLKGKYRGRMGRGRGGGHMGNIQNNFEMMNTCQQSKQMNNNGKDKMTQKEHKQPREIHKQVSNFLIHIKKKHVA